MVGGVCATDGDLTVQPGASGKPLLAPLVSHRLAEILAGDGGPYAKRICVFLFPNGTYAIPCDSVGSWRMCLFALGSPFDLVGFS